MSSSSSDSDDSIDSNLSESGNEEEPHQAPTSITANTLDDNAEEPDEGEGPAQGDTNREASTPPESPPHTYTQSPVPQLTEETQETEKSPSQIQENEEETHTPDPQEEDLPAKSRNDDEKESEADSSDEDAKKQEGGEKSEDSDMEVKKASPAKRIRTMDSSSEEESAGEKGKKDSEEESAGEKGKKDSEEESAGEKGKKDSEEDEEHHPQTSAPPTQEDLFGEGLDVSSDEDDEKEEEEEIVGPRLYVEEEDEEEREQAPQETVIEVEAPRIAVDLGSQLHFVKFPNFLSVEPRPFDQEMYEDEIDEDDVLDEEGRSRLKLKVENTIRWRHAVDEEGNPTKESNAKIVRWSDGTMSMYLGAEIFDVHMQPTQGDHNHLFVRQGAGLQGQEIFRTKLSFRPHSTDTLTHRKMTLSMADRSNKAQKVKVLASVGRDPESQKQEMVRREEERLRASARKESLARRVRERNMNRGISAGYLEDYDSDEGESLSAIKKSYKPGGREFERGARNIPEDESPGEVSEEGADRLERAKRIESDDDEDEEPFGAERKIKKRRVIEDSDEEDED